LPFKTSPFADQQEKMMNSILISQGWLSDVFSSNNLQIMLLFGSGILAISLLVLALTRWGHSRPVWKCVILSFVAHILLMGYAYGTRLIFETPAVVKQDNPMRVNFIEESGKSVEDLDETDAGAKPWDQFVNDQVLPEVEQLVRPEIDSEIVIPRQVDRSVEKPASPQLDTDLDDLPNDFQPSQLTTPKPQIALDQMDHSKVELEEIDVRRRGEENEAEKPKPAFDSLTEISRPDIPNEFQPAGNSFPSSNALVAPKPDNAFVSELVHQNAENPISNESLPTASAAPKFEMLKPVGNSSPASRKLKIVSSTRRIADGQPLPKIYSLRNASNRLAVAKNRGGSVDTERAVDMALQWLANNQADDGSWDPQQTGAGNEDKVFGHNRGGAGAQAECGITGLATLAFLGAGESHFEGQYQNKVQKALEYLARQQKSNGDLSGDARLFAKMYCHSMSLLALSEALAMTGDQRLLPVVQNGVDFSIAAQNRTDGGWRYQPGDAGDMSQFGWQVLALKSAKLGNAVVPDAVFKRMETFLSKCTSGVGNGLASYRPNQGPSTTMTAEALLCRYMLQNQVAPMTSMEATRRIATERPTPSHVNLYYWYYGTLAMYHAGGSQWEVWNKELKHTLLKLQRQSGSDAGSWPANGVWGGYGGRVYSTSMAALNLEVYYRYLPLYQEVAGANELRSIRKR
jgi:hypothetical protein